MKRVLDLSEMQRYFADLHQGKPLDDVDRVTYMKVIGKIREIFQTPGLLDLIHVYQTTLNDEAE